MIDYFRMTTDIQIEIKKSKFELKN